MISGKLVDIFDHQVCFMEYNDTALFNFSPQQVFDVISDIEKYPEFLPGWISSRIIDKQHNKVTVEQEVGIAFLNWHFTSEAVFDPPFHIQISSHKGPFIHLDIDWKLCPAQDNKTRVSLAVKSDSNPGPHHRFLHGIFSNSTGSLMNYFEERLRNIYPGA